jgi:ATP-binding cassette subfamily C protein CydC
VKDLLRLLGLFAPYRYWMGLGVVLSLLTLAANVGLLALSAWFITAMAAAGLAGVSMNYFTPAAMIRAFAIVRTGGRYLERLVTHEATLRLLSELRVWFYRHLEPLAPARLQHYRGGDLLSRIRADIDALDRFYLQVLVPSLVAVLGVAAGLWLLLRYDAGIAWTVTIALILAGGVVPWLMARLGRRPGQRMVDTEAELRSAVVDGVQGLAELEVYGAADRQGVRLDRLGRGLAEDQARMARLAGTSQAALLLFANLSLWGVLWLGIPLIGEGRLNGAQLAMLALFASAAFQAVLPLPEAFQALGRTLRAARRVFEIVDAEPEVIDPPGPSPIPRGFGIQLRGVGFRYRQGDDWVLEDFDLSLEEGEKVALVGPTGSGKSTVASLLLRFREYRQGSIRLGGHELRSYRAEDLRRLIATVSQHTHLFNTTIRENLLIANPEAPLAALQRAAEAARIDGLIRSWPEGWDTYVGEAGRKLSGGQARRVAIARALLEDAPILILDEPTEGLDAATEREIMASIHDLMERRTVLLITHRTVGLEGMDRVARLGS